MKKINCSIFFISMSILSMQVALIRYFSIINSAEFVSMMISIALLGFGFSGTLITLLKNRITGSIDKYLYASNVLFAISISYCFLLSSKVPFVPQSIHQDMTQVLYIGVYYILYFIVFLFGSAVINLSFMKTENIGRLYFFNMTGSGVGALIIIVLMFVLQPQYIIIPSILFALGALFFHNTDKTSLKKRYAVNIAVIIISLLPFLSGKEISYSEYKDISYALKFPDAEIIETIPSPYGLIQVMRSSQFHFAPGLSLSSYDVETPTQDGLFLDGYSSSGMVSVLKDNEKSFVNFIPFSLPFCLNNSPKVLIIGSGGGNPILYSDLLGSETITAVEPNYPLVKLLTGKYNTFLKPLLDSGKLKLTVSDGRSYCKGDRNKYDIVTIPAMLSSGMSFSSGAGNGENYIFTTEALDDYCSHLSENGILNISTNIKSPPRTSLKLTAMSFAYLKNKHKDDYANRIIVLRGLDWLSIMIKNSPFTADDIAAVKKKNADLSADFSYYPGITPEEININNYIDDELYYKLAVSFLEGSENDFINGYCFNITPPVDNRPFFNHSINAVTISKLLSKDNELENIPYSEWGYFVSWGTFLQGLFFSLLIISLPVFFLRKDFAKQNNKFKVIAYFSALGLGFMFIEIAVIQKLLLLIGNPAFSSAIVISSLLLFSGVGAYYSERISSSPRKTLAIAVVSIIAVLSLHYFVFAKLLDMVLVFSQFIRIIISVILIAPLGFFMGIPFPSGLKAVSGNGNLFPWALAINGSVSVFAAVLTNLISMHFGFSAVFILSGLLYLSTILSFPEE